MAQVRRFDFGELKKPTRMDNGWIRVEAYLARSGVQAYRTPEGKERLEYRPPEEVFNADSLKSFTAVPVTNEHPPEVLTATNTRKYQVGHLMGEPVQDGDKMRAALLITDADTIADMEAGKLEISNGYMVELDETPGVSPDGQRYDAVQKNIVGNHTALVTQGRAGSEVRARMDKADAVMIVSIPRPSELDSARTKKGMLKFKIDGIEVEIPEQAAQLIEKERAVASAKIDASQAESNKAKTERDAQAARADKAEKDLKASQAELAAAPEKLKKDLSERARLDVLARKVCGEEFETEGKSDIEVRTAIAATQTDADLTGKSDAYVDALVDIASKRQDDKSAAAEVFAKTVKVEQPNDKPKDVYAAAADTFKKAGAQASK